MNPYFPPPDDYHQAGRCERCEELIMFVPVVGGHMWRHVVSSDHPVVMRPEGYWDTSTGKIVHGNPLRRVA